MAFNLSKNDGESKKKFDLSKSDESTPDLQEPKKSNKTILIIVILAVVVIGVYFFINKDTKSEEASVATVDSSSLVASTDTKSTTQSTANETAETTSVAPEVTTPTTFEKGSADVISVDETKISQLLEYLKTNANVVITVEGYASSEGDAEFNNQLSEARAKNFAKYLVSKGVKEENIKTIGKGTENPIASNEDEAGRSQNRRVEIKF